MDLNSNLGAVRLHDLGLERIKRAADRAGSVLNNRVLSRLGYHLSAVNDAADGVQLNSLADLVDKSIREVAVNGLGQGLASNVIYRAVNRYLLGAIVAVDLTFNNLRLVTTV